MRYNPELTAKKREYPSFPTKWLFNQNLIKGEVLDFGSGYGKDGEFLRDKGFDVTDYDPYYKPEFLSNSFDTILCQYVLNILPPSEQSFVIMRVSELLKEDGKAFFAVRRDITDKNKGIRIHKEYKKPTLQLPVKLPFKSVLNNDYCEIYEYQPLQTLKEGAECPFCSKTMLERFITESSTCYAIFDKYPVNKGHALIIPKVHESDYFQLDNRHQYGLNLVLKRTKTILEQKFNPDSFNTGVNIGEYAGQTVNHVHVHLIPRYEGDIDNPIGGVRNIIPEKGDYLSDSRKS